MNYRSQELKLSQKSLIQEIRFSGHCYQGKYIKVYFLKNNLINHKQKICISVNKKVGIAVLRNKVKRVIRNLLLQVVKDDSRYCLVLIKDRIAEKKKIAPYWLLEKDVQNVFSKN